MKKIPCKIEYGEDYNDYDTTTPTTTAVCGRCGHRITSWGNGDASIRRCLVLLKNECPNQENNFYVTADQARSEAEAKMQRKNQPRQQRQEQHIRGMRRDYDAPEIPMVTTPMDDIPY